MSIKTLYGQYVQKSRIFLYPALEIQRGTSVTPILTYTSWKGKISPEDKKLICLYHLRDDQEYRTFEKNKLLNHKMYDTFKEIGDNKGVYIFDFEKYSQDWDLVMKGKYSKLSPDLKRKIKTFFKANSSDYVYIESYINPEKYFALYADLLGVQIALLKQVGELCSPPDPKEEVLDASIKNLEIESINS